MGMYVFFCKRHENYYNGQMLENASVGAVQTYHEKFRALPLLYFLCTCTVFVYVYVQLALTPDDD